MNIGHFAASVVEVYTSEFGVFTIHFDDNGEHYLQLQAIPEREHDEQSARVYVEIDNQGIADADCFSSAELRRNSFRLVFVPGTGLEELVVSFELDSDRFADLCAAMTRMFDGTTEYSLRRS